jgi:hypothetical protein
MQGIFSSYDMGLGPKLEGLVETGHFPSLLGADVSQDIGSLGLDGKIDQTPLGVAKNIVPEIITSIQELGEVEPPMMSGLPAVDPPPFTEPINNNPSESAIDPLTGDELDLDSLPLSFMANAGQFNPNVHSLVQGAKQAIAFTPNEIIFNSADQIGTESSPNPVKLTFSGANANPTIHFLEPLPGVANFIKGQNQENWVTNVPTYEGLIYQELYNGIDLQYRGDDSQLKSDFIVEPGANPHQIRFNYSGVEDISIREDGALVIQTPFGELIENAPIAYQEINGQRTYVDAEYILEPNLEPNQTVRFQLGDYDRTSALIIDPTIQYSSYLGGSLTDSISDVVVNRSGNIIVTGSTNSSDFTNQFSVQSNFGGGAFDGDAFVTKLSLDGTGVVFSTFLGGSGNETAKGVEVDNAGNIYIGGKTTSENFPVVNPFQSSSADNSDFEGDAFVTKLSEDGSSLVYSTYFGGSGVEDVGDIALENTGSVYLIGTTNSADLPVQNAVDSQLDGNQDAFLTKFSVDGTRLIFSTFLGGSDREFGEAIVTDNGGSTYITGTTESEDLPVVAAFQSVFGGQSDALVGKFDPNGNPVYLTYLGGGDVDQGLAIAIDQSRNAYVTGKTGLSDVDQPFAASEPPEFESTRDFPLVNPFQGTFFGGYDDAFLTKFNDNGSGLLYSTYLGGQGTDLGQAIAVDSEENVYLAGTTNSNDFPQLDPLQRAFGGNRDIFLTKFAPDGQSQRYSSYIGGGDIDSPSAIALDLNNNVYIAGFTNSNNFPTQQPFQGTLQGVGDGFVLKVTPETGPVPRQFESYREYVVTENLSLLSLFYDENYYLANNPDVADAVAAGVFSNGQEHYLLQGQSERRNPSALFNESLYLSLNPDVAGAVAAGAIKSGFEHFNRFGFSEGRDRRIVLFDREFYLSTNPDVLQAVIGGAFKSAYEHYIKSGQFERRNPNRFFDDRFYVESNPDVAQALANGSINSGFEHFALFGGETQGRQVSPGYDESFYLADNPDIAAAVNAGLFRSGFEHYIKYGFPEG